MDFIEQLSITLNQLKDIIEGLLKDSPQAMKRMFEMFYKPLCSYAVRYVQSMPVAEEIVSDVMYKIWQNRNKNYRSETFREYLYTATRNTALNHLKQQQNQRELSENWAEQYRGDLIEETPLDIMIAEETQSKLNRLIENLPEQCRKALMLSRMEDMSYDEIAAQMGISINTVKYHIKTALQKLRAELGTVLAWLIFLWTFSVIFFLHLPTLFPFSIVLTLFPVMP